MRILDIGCGRGELALHCAGKKAHVWGIDYARAALELAGEAVSEAGEQIRRRISLMQVDARQLPFESESMDVAFMLDVVEHLEPKELDRALQEARRVLRPGGKLVVHTMPNLWYYHYGYPVYRALQRLRGQQLPADPRDRWAFKDVHVNEQTPRAMGQALRRNGFNARVWLKSTRQYAYEGNRVVRYGMQFLVSAPLVRSVFCNDIFALAINPD
jgi:ubiquinone/menaquinone biosynthesis C-methylase UbiE